MSLCDADLFFIEQLQSTGCKDEIFVGGPLDGKSISVDARVGVFSCYVPKDMILYQESINPNEEKVDVVDYKRVWFVNGSERFCRFISDEKDYVEFCRVIGIVNIADWKDL